MPLFDFKCKSCKHVKEYLVKNSDPAPFCDQCGHPTERLIGKSSFHLKGTGWYETDFSGKVRQPEIKG